MKMSLNQLFKNLKTKEIVGDLNIAVTDLHSDSRKIKEGGLFICISGYNVDGHEFANKAIENGAVAIVAEKKLNLSKGITQMIVEDTKKILPELSNRFFEYPHKKLKIIGITGTNGKTTTTHLIASILKDSEYKVGLIGTMYTEINGTKEETKNTTPDALELQRTLHKMVEAKCDYAIMEVSSHGLVLGRVDGIDFSIGGFTNLTQDHLDFHKTMEAYEEAKGLLFQSLGSNSFAVLNEDESSSKKYKQKTIANIRTYGIDNAAFVTARNLRLTPKGTLFTLKTKDLKKEIQLKLIGKFNVYNALCAFTVCQCEGIPIEKIIASLEKIEGVRGRFENVNAGQKFNVIVDYAHTPDGLENVLQTAKEFTKGRVICVVGCGGDRDKTKRPVMANISTNLADLSVFTSDNPRSEDPETILDDMLKKIEISEQVFRESDREKAIEYAISNANEGDTIVIAGKGHETYQIIGKTTAHFDDREVAIKIIEKRRG